jgi:hypothetical protein
VLDQEFHHDGRHHSARSTRADDGYGATATIVLVRVEIVPIPPWQDWCSILVCYLVRYESVPSWFRVHGPTMSIAPHRGWSSFVDKIAMMCRVPFQPKTNASDRRRQIRVVSWRPPTGYNDGHDSNEYRGR